MLRAGIVLCGGRSTRMGQPKALLAWQGRTLIEHVVGCLAPCVDELLVVTSRTLALPEGVAAQGARIVVDREPERGPLAALRDGLAAARAELAFVTATDAPFLTRAYVDLLFDRASAERRAGGLRAVVPRAAGHLQVLSAVYPCAAWEEAEGLLSAGDASPTALLARIGFDALDCDATDLAAAAAAPAAWTGFNTPEQYAAALAFAGRD